jgi:hypothetical protein
MRASSSATSLTGAAFGTNAARACANDLVAAANRARDSHEDATERDHDSVVMTIAIPAVSCSTGSVRRIICDHVDHLFVAGPRQLRDRPVQSLLFDLDNFLEWQVRLRTIGRRCFLVAFDELARQPAENVVRDARRVADVGIFCEAARLESLIREFFHQALERHTVLERD